MIHYAYLFRAWRLVVNLIQITCTCWYDVAVTVHRLFSGLSYWEPRACVVENRPGPVSLQHMPMQPFLTHTWLMQLTQYGCRNKKQDVSPLTCAALACSVSCLYGPQYIWMSWLKRHSRQGCRPDLHQISLARFLSTPVSLVWCTKATPSTEGLFKLPWHLYEAEWGGNYVMSITEVNGPV